MLHDPRLFCSLVSDTLRIYLEERFHFRAPERTTEEFLQELHATTLLNTDQKQRLAEFLAQCDLVKFARFEPAELTLRALLDAALRLIDETRYDALASSAPATASVSPPPAPQPEISIHHDPGASIFFAPPVAPATSGMVAQQARPGNRLPLLLRAVGQTCGRNPLLDDGKNASAMRWIVLALFIIGLARPQLIQRETAVKASGIDIVVALDISGTMSAEDFNLRAPAVNRLAIAKDVLEQFIAKRSNDRIGLVAFAGRAYIAGPLTLDHDFLLQNLVRLDLGTIEDGTAIGSALSTAVNRLREIKSKSKIVILMTDGQNNAGNIPPLTAAEAAQALGVKVYTIGVGTRGIARMPVTGPFGHVCTKTSRSISMRRPLKRSPTKLPASITEPTAAILCAKSTTKSTASNALKSKPKNTSASKKCFIGLSSRDFSCSSWNCCSLTLSGEDSHNMHNSDTWRLFEHPELLWALLILVPGPVAFFWWAWKAKQRLISQFVQSRLLANLTVGVSAKRQKWRIALLVFAAALLVVILARPQWGFTWEEAKQRGLDVVVALDTSRSMLAPDVAPNRLSRAKLAALDLKKFAKTDRVGLVAFAGTAFLQCPLSFDDDAFRQSLQALDATIIPQGGTALAEAIHAAESAFKDKNENHKILVIFSDGEDHDGNALEAARAAAKNGLRIFTVGVGTGNGELLRVTDSRGVAITSVIVKATSSNPG